MSLRLAVLMCLFFNIPYARAECVAGEQTVIVPARVAYRLLTEFVAAGPLDVLSKGGFFEDGRCRVQLSTPAEDGRFRLAIVERVVGTNFGRHDVAIEDAVPVKVACGYVGDVNALRTADVLSMGADDQDHFLVNMRGSERFVQVPNPKVLAFYVSKLVRCQSRR